MRNSFVFAGLCAYAFAQAIVIDDYSAGFGFQSSLVDFNYEANDATVPGGVRSIDHDFISNPRNRTIQTEIDALSPGHLFIESGSKVVGAVDIYYGGGALPGTPNDRPFDFPDFNGFGPLDLSGETAFKISYTGNDQDSTGLTMRVFDGTNTGTFAGTTIAAGNGMVLVPFADFTGGVDFSKIDKIHLRIGLPDANDIGLTQFEAVPEPATLGVLAMAGLGALTQRRKK